MADSRNQKFGTVVNCIDGRAQQPAADWIRLNCGVEFVDAITTPGAEQLLSEEESERSARIRSKVLLSAGKHMSSVVAVVGHFDCTANPCEPDERKTQILKAAAKLSSWKTGLRVVGLYVNEWQSVEVVCDSDEDHRLMKSYL